MHVGFGHVDKISILAILVACIRTRVMRKKKKNIMTKNISLENSRRRAKQPDPNIKWQNNSHKICWDWSNVLRFYNRFLALLSKWFLQNISTPKQNHCLLTSANRATQYNIENPRLSANSIILVVTKYNLSRKLVRVSQTKNAFEEALESLSYLWIWNDHLRS